MKGIIRLSFDNKTVLIAVAHNLETKPMRQYTREEKIVMFKECDKVINSYLEPTYVGRAFFPDYVAHVTYDGTDYWHEITSTHRCG